MLVRLLLLLALVAVPAARAEYGYRELEATDEWDYAFRATPQGEPPSSGFMKLRVEGFETIDGERIAHLVRYEGCAPGAQPCEWTHAREFWWRASDLASIRVRSWEMRGGELAEDGETSWTPPCDENAFPIAAGDEWTTDCTATNKGGRMTPGTMPFQMRRVARAEEEVDTGAGRLRAIPVEIGDPRGGEPFETQWYSADACGWARTETAPPVRAGYSLLAYRCGERSVGTLRALAADLDAQREAPGAPAASVVALLATAALLARKRS